MEPWFQKRSDFYTHVVLDGHKGCYYLPMNQRRSFLEAYGQQERQWCLAEKPGSTMPFLVDVDLSRPVDLNDLDDDVCNLAQPLYTRSQLLALVHHCQAKIQVLLEPCDVTCFVLEKEPRIVSGGIIKHGFHLHFPFVFTKLEVTRLLHEACNTFPGFALDNIIGKCWLVYGSAKSLVDKPYEVTFVVESNGKQYDSVELALNSLDECYGTRNQVASVFERLVTLLSINPIGKPTVGLKEANDDAPPNVDASLVTSYHDDGSVVDEDKMQLLEMLLPVLKTMRSDDYHSWWEIGAILHWESKGNQHGYELFDQFSRRSKKYDAEACYKAWEQFSRRSFVQRPKTYGTLLYYCRLDDDVKTNSILNAWKTEKSSTTPQYTEYRLACEFFEFYPECYLYCSQTKWYVFTGHCWKAVPDVYIYIVKKFITLSSLLVQRLADKTDKEEIRNLQQAIRRLETTGSQNGIIRQLSSFYFHSEDLPKILNANPELIAFSNGVYDLKNLQFRDGRHSDYITKCLPVEYKRPSQESLRVMFDFFEKIFPDAVLRKYFFQVICDIFEGGNQEKLGFFWTGNGNNGKSKTQLLIQLMMGWELGCKLPTTVMTSEKPKQGSPSPELALLHGGVRWAVYDEPDSNVEKIKAGTFKHLTGNDSIYARPLRLNPLQFTPMNKTTIICNALPLIDGADEATWLRVMVIPFESKFSSRAPSDPAEQQRLKHFPIDKYVERSFDEMAATLAWYLIEEYKSKRERELAGQRLFVPQKVKNAILNYQVRCDTILKSCEQIFIRVDKEADGGDPKVLFRLLHKHFKIFLPNETITFSTFMQNYNEVIDKGSWYRPKTAQDTQNNEPAAVDGVTYES